MPISNPADYRVGDLIDPRPRVEHARSTTWTMKLSAMLRVVFLIRAEFFIADMFGAEIKWNCCRCRLK